MHISGIMVKTIDQSAPAMLVTSRGATQEVSAPMCSKSIPIPTDEAIPYGYCQCGCGERTTPVKRNHHDRGIRKGDHPRFLPEHAGRVRVGPRMPRPVPIPVSPAAALIPLVGNKGEGYFALVDTEDLELVTPHRWYLHRARNLVYAVTKPVGDRTNTLLMHRLLASDSGDLVTDHKNGNGLDNRRSNLRFATMSQNAQNSRRVDSRSVSPYRGVFFGFRKGMWRAHICVDGEHRTIGHFETAIDAARAYDDAARQYHGAFAVLNFPQVGERGDTP